MDLDKKFEEIVERLDNMDADTFQKMLAQCGADRIKPSRESSYVSCLRMSFSKKNEEYRVGSDFKLENMNNYNDYEVNSTEQEAA